ncbi:MAG: hypothetical protein ACTFAK_09725 [Candidatus Electronema sp. VV]
MNPQAIFCAFPTRSISRSQNSYSAFQRRISDLSQAGDGDAVTVLYFDPLLVKPQCDRPGHCAASLSSLFVFLEKLRLDFSIQCCISECKSLEAAIQTAHFPCNLGGIMSLFGQLFNPLLIRTAAC